MRTNRSKEIRESENKAQTARKGLGNVRTGGKPLERECYLIGLLYKGFYMGHPYPNFLLMCFCWGPKVSIWEPRQKAVGFSVAGPTPLRNPSRIYKHPESSHRKLAFWLNRESHTSLAKSLHIGSSLIARKGFQAV